MCRTSHSPQLCRRYVREAGEETNSRENPSARCWDGDDTELGAQGLGAAHAQSEEEGDMWRLPQWPRWPWGRILRMTSQGGQRKEGIPWRRRSIRQWLNGHKETSETSRSFGYSKVTDLEFDASFLGWSPHKETKTVGMANSDHTLLNPHVYIHTYAVMHHMYVLGNYEGT